MNTGKPVVGWGVLLAAFALLVGAGSACASSIFFAGKLEDGAFVPDASVKGSCFAIRYSTIATTVDGARARTKVEEAIAGPEAGEVATVWLVVLPEGADGKDAALRAGVRGEAPKAVEAKFLPAAEAQRVFEAIAKGTGSAAVLALSGRSALLVPQFRLGPKVDVVIEFRHEVSETAGLYTLSCPMPASSFAREAVGRLALTATVRNERPLRAVFSPTHETLVERTGLYEARARVTMDNWRDGSEYRLVYVADEDPLGLRVLAHRGEDDEDGYFLLIGNPTGSPKPEKAIEKDVLFVLDTSGSMRGEKIEQARASVDYCLERLNPGDRFNLITFGTEVRSFRDGLVAKTPANLAAASAFADEVVATGRTNISGALARGLAGQAEKGRPRIMIFLTDGTPTAGELVPEKILETLPKLNASGTRVFVLGVGHDVNAHLLDRLAELTDGSSEYVDPKEEIDVNVAALYNRLSHPVLTDVELAFGDLPTYAIYPQKIPALFKGSEIMIAGRYRGGGKHTVALAGTLNGEPRRYACTVDLPETGKRGPGFVASLWAARKIGYLLQEIRLHGENPELVEEVIRLSRQFGIVTEYTVFLAMAETKMSNEEVAKEAVKRMRKANEQQAGQWAVNQALNDRDLQNRVVAGAAANVYRDRRGRVQAAEGLRQVGRRAFYLRDGRWVDAEDAGKRKERKVKLFSKEYFELLRSNRDFAAAQAVGENVTMNVGDERIVVEE